MRFNTVRVKPEPDVLITMHRENDQDDDLDLYFDDNLVAFFADGKLWTISFPTDSPVMAELEKKGIQFVKRLNGAGYRLDIEL